jgi:hypothetical protein
MSCHGDGPFDDAAAGRKIRYRNRDIYSDALAAAPILFPFFSPVSHFFTFQPDLDQATDGLLIHD